jgi:CRISPR-associated protein Csb2
MLALEIEYLAGVCFAAPPESSPAHSPDWPPQPDRIFSALVCAWGARGERPEERAALEWLEQQPPPTIEASGAEPRHVATVYVPPNDISGKRETLPERRRRQPRLFPAAIPHRPVVRVRWTAAAPSPSLFESLQCLAGDMAYLGHSASLVRCRFMNTLQPDPELNSLRPRRRVYPGRLQALERAYRAGERPLPGEIVPAAEVVDGPAIACSIFSRRWILFEDAGGTCPDLRAIAVVARRAREAIMSQFGSDAVPEFISGHQPDGSPSVRPHLAIVPLADAGWRYSQGRLMGLGIILPEADDQARIQAERDWLAGIEERSAAAEQWRAFDRALDGVSKLALGPLGVWKLARAAQPSKMSMRIERYTGPHSRWFTVTPIVLDRFPKCKSPQERDDEIASIIASSCENIGLPRPVAVRTFKHSAVKGAPSAYPSGNAPQWTGWTLPDFLAHRMLTHAAIDFSQPVSGPLILGAGRFAGLGLCLGVQDESTER